MIDNGSMPSRAETAPQTRWTQIPIQSLPIPDQQMERRHRSSLLPDIYPHLPPVPFLTTSPPATVRSLRYIRLHSCGTVSHANPRRHVLITMFFPRVPIDLFP